MQSTPIKNFPYPDESDSNDVPADIGRLAKALEKEDTWQGPYQERPPAGTRGRLYFATVRIDPFISPATYVPWNVLYRDDGTKWVQVNASAVQTYHPTWDATSGAGFVISLTGGNAACEYQVMPGGRCWLNINQQMSLSGTTGLNAGVTASLPVPAISFAGAAGTAQNFPPTIGIESDNQRVAWYPTSYINGGQWNTGSPFWFRATAEYRVA